MSNMILGDVYFSAFYRQHVIAVRNQLQIYCCKQGFGIHFLSHEIFPVQNDSEKSEGKIRFQLSDSFIAPNCEDFMDLVYYTKQGVPLIEPLKRDLEKLQGIVDIIFSFDFVNHLELRFSFVEVNEDEYEICRVSQSGLKKEVYERYIESKGNIPVVNFIITREGE